MRNDTIHIVKLQVLETELERLPRKVCLRVIEQLHTEEEGDLNVAILALGEGTEDASRL